MSSRHTMVTFKGGPLGGTQRAKTTTGRPPLYLTVEGAPLLTSKGDRILNPSGLPRSPRVAVRSCYLKDTDAYDSTGRRVITYRYITSGETA